MSRTVTDVLIRADETIHGERVSTYGPASVSFGRIGRLVTEMLDEDDLAAMAKGKITAPIVLKVMTGAKLVRQAYSPMNDDHRVDACGYIAMLDEILKDAQLAKKNEAARAQGGVAPAISVKVGEHFCSSEVARG